MIYLFSFITIVSLAVSGALIWYIRRLVSKFLFLEESFVKITADLNGFHEHLERVYKMDVFFGDETLQSLLEHSESTRQSIGEFLTVFEIEENAE